MQATLPMLLSLPSSMTVAHADCLVTFVPEWTDWTLLVLSCDDGCMRSGLLPVPSTSLQTSVLTMIYRPNWATQSRVDIK